MDLKVRLERAEAEKRGAEAALQGIQRRGLIARILNRKPVLPLSQPPIRNSRSTTAS